jgi:hypothetical protein
MTGRPSIAELLETTVPLLTDVPATHAPFTIEIPAGMIDAIARRTAEFILQAGIAALTTLWMSRQARRRATSAATSARPRRSALASTYAVSSNSSRPAAQCTPPLDRRQVEEQIDGAIGYASRNPSPPVFKAAPGPVRTLEQELIRAWIEIAEVRYELLAETSLKDVIAGLEAALEAWR